MEYKRLLQLEGECKWSWEGVVFLAQGTFNAQERITWQMKVDKMSETSFYSVNFQCLFPHA